MEVFDAIFNRKGGPVPGKWVPPSKDEYSPYDSSHPVFVTDPKAEMHIRVAKKGSAAMAPTTISALFEAAAKMHASKEALKVERDGAWKTWTWGQYFSDAKRAAHGFMSFGLRMHDCVNIIGFNSPEWFLAQMGAILAGGKAAGVYTTNEASACKCVKESSRALLVPPLA